MTRMISLAAAGAVAVVGIVSAQQPDPIQAAVAALGVSKLQTVKMAGFGANYSVGQSPSPNEAWPRVTIKSYEALINYQTGSMQVDLVREQGPVQPRGGGAPFTGEQRQIQLVSGALAWNVAMTPPPPSAAAGGPQAQVAALAKAGDAPPPLVAQPPEAAPGAALERRLHIVSTPHGFLKAALANAATMRRVDAGTEVLFTLEGKYKFVGLLNSRNEVERIQTWIDNPLLGDMLIETAFTSYEAADGIAFPRRISQRQGGFPALDLWLHSVQPNVSADIAVPETVKTAKPAPVAVEVQTVAPGVHWLTGGSHHSVAIEMRDHVIVVEAPQTEARSLAVLAKVRETIPTKPIRFVVNTHSHFDHAGGLRTYVHEGVTVVTHQLNVPFYERAWAAPRTLDPDRLAQSNKPAAFAGFADKHVLTDGARTAEIHRMAYSPHHEGFALVYLPAEKIVIEADAYTPPAVAPTPPPGEKSRAAAAAPAPTVNPTALNLYQNIRRLKLETERIVPLHGSRVATMKDLEQASGRPGTN